MADSIPLRWTGDAHADALISHDAVAMLIGFALDQQVTVQKAFSGPLELEQRIGTLSPRFIAAIDPDSLAATFADRPALHRFPAAMAKRVQDLCAVLSTTYDGDPTRMWSAGEDANTVRGRLLALPGIGEMQATTIVAVLVQRLGVELAGWQALMPDHATLGDVDSPEALAAYQAGKRARKSASRVGTGCRT